MTKMIQVYPELAIDVSKNAKEITDEILKSNLFNITESNLSPEIILSYKTKPLNIDYQVVLIFNTFTPDAILEYIVVYFFNYNKWYKTTNFGKKYLYDMRGIKKTEALHSSKSVVGKKK